jgi:hypothetical protein
MRVNYYYDLTDWKKHTNDGEGCLVQLCDQCAADINETAGEAEVKLASRGDEDSICEVCDANQHGVYVA